MKRFKLNKAGRRLWRTLGVILSLLMLWNFYYFSTFTRFRESGKSPLTTTVVNPNYQEIITKAGRQLEGTSRRLDIPSFSVAVGHKGKLVWAAAEGYQNLENKIPATPKTQYRIGSSSKSLTATGIALAIQEGTLALDTVIGDTIDNWPKKEWSFTMRQLLSHTAGVGNYEDFGFASVKYTLCNCHEFTTATQGLKVFNKYDLLYEPGTDFAYSTFDVNLASAILEQTTQEPFPAYMQSNVFQPLEMKDTYADHLRDQSEHFATFYEMEDRRYREYHIFEQVYDINLSYKWAGGGFISTPSDLVRLGNAWLTNSTFINQETKKDFWTPVKLANGKVNEQEYAVCFRSYLDYTNNLLDQGRQTYWIVHHGGVSKGSMNFLLLFPDYDLVIDASINARAASFGDFSAEVHKLANLFLQEIKI